MSDADVYGRVWMHCEQGLTMTKASMSRFMMFVLPNNVEIGKMYAFSPRYRGSTVIASVRLRLDQFEAFERGTGGKLQKPPRIHLNSEAALAAPAPTMADMQNQTDALLTDPVAFDAYMEANPLPVATDAVRRATIEEVIREIESSWGHVATPELRDAIRALADRPTGGTDAV